MANKRAKVFQVSFRPTLEHKINCDAEANEEKHIDIIRSVMNEHYKDKEPFGWKDYIKKLKL